MAKSAEMDHELLLVDGLKALHQKLDQQYGPVLLLMSLAVDIGIEDWWKLVVSAKGLDQHTRAEAVHIAADLMRESLPKQVWPSIARLVILQTDDPFVKGMNRWYKAEDDPLMVQSATISGVEIPKAIVLQSKAV
jgi:hypothetical protein